MKLANQGEGTTMESLGLRGLEVRYLENLRYLKAVDPSTRMVSQAAVGGMLHARLLDHGC